MVLKMPGSCFVLLLPLFLGGCSKSAGTAGERRSTDGRSSTTDHPVTLLTPSAKTIDLGIVPQAGREQETFELTNPGTEPVEIAEFKISCDCLGIELLRPEVGPSQKVLALATLDLGKEPQFLGNLGIEVKALTPDGKTAFFIVVEVAVRPAHLFAQNNPRSDDH